MLAQKQTATMLTRPHDHMDRDTKDKVRLHKNPQGFIRLRKAMCSLTELLYLFFLCYVASQEMHHYFVPTFRAYCNHKKQPYNTAILHLPSNCYTTFFFELLR